jgi:hypothetical protein
MAWALQWVMLWVIGMVGGREVLVWAWVGLLHGSSEWAVAWCVGGSRWGCRRSGSLQGLAFKLLKTTVNGRIKKHFRPVSTIRAYRAEICQYQSVKKCFFRS